MKFCVELAGVTVEIESLFDSTMEFCKEYLTDNNPSINISVSQTDIDIEREKNIHPDINFSDEYLETLAVYRKVAEALVERGILLFHGSCISVDGKAYLFTAPSGTGKSTHTRLWRKVIPSMGHEVTMINDDKPLLKIEDDKVYVYGTPWNGKHRLGTNSMAPLNGFCILSRGVENKINQISKEEAWKHALAACYRPNNPISTAQTLSYIDKMVTNIRFYALSCNMNEDAPLVAFNAMNH